MPERQDARSAATTVRKVRAWSIGQPLWRLIWAVNAVGGTYRFATHHSPGIFGTPWWGWGVWATWSLLVLTHRGDRV